MKTCTTALLTLIFIAAENHSALACAACYGDTSGSKMGNAAAVGIGAMVIIMFAMLGTIFAVGRHFVWRAKNPLPDYDELLGEDGSSNPQPPDTKS
jgi:hypothetical protein